MVDSRKQLGLRVRDEVVERLDQIDKGYGVGNRTATLEWMILRAADELDNDETLRRIWTRKLADEFGGDAVITVYVDREKEPGSRKTVTDAFAMIGDKEPMDLEVGVEELDSGGLEVFLVSTVVSPFDPSVVFDRMTAAQVAEARASTGWEDSEDMAIRMTRKVSELASLPLADAPGETSPEVPAKKGGEGP